MATFFLAVASISSTVAADTNTPANGLRVLVTGIEAARGTIVCALFSSGDGFPFKLEQSTAIVQYPASSGLLTCSFSGVPAGRHAVSVLHDGNGNRERDDSVFGKGEAWGVSKNVRRANRAPRFGEASVSMPGDRSLDIEVALQR